MTEDQNKLKWVSSVSELYPAVKGSVREVKKGCGYKSCKLCASGKKHQAYLFTYYKDGRQCSHHVPKPKLEELRKSLENGRELERLMVENALELLKSSRQKK